MNLYEHFIFWVVYSKKLNHFTILMSKLLITSAVLEYETCKLIYNQE